MDNTKKKIEFNKNEYQLKVKLSIYVINKMMLLKNGYIFMYFSKENTYTYLSWENLDEEEREKVKKMNIFHFYNPRTFKKEISFTENDKLCASRELSNGNLIFFFKNYFKIYKILKKEIIEIQKTNFIIDNNKNGYFNFIELSSTEFLFNKGIITQKKYRKGENGLNNTVLTQKFTLDNNNKYIGKNINKFPFGEMLKFKDTFFLIQTFYDPNKSGRYIVNKNIYLYLNNNYYIITNILPTDSINMPDLYAFNEDLFLFYRDNIIKYSIDINKISSINGRYSIDKNKICLNYNSLFKDNIKKDPSYYFHYFSNKDNTLNLFLQFNINNFQYFKLNKEFQLIQTEKISFTNRYKEIKFIGEDKIIIMDKNNSYSYKAKHGFYFYEKINKNHL